MENEKYGCTCIAQDTYELQVHPSSHLVGRHWPLAGAATDFHHHCAKEDNSKHPASISSAKEPQFCSVTLRSLICVLLLQRATQRRSTSETPWLHSVQNLKRPPPMCPLTLLLCLEQLLFLLLQPPTAQAPEDHEVRILLLVVGNQQLHHIAGQGGLLELRLAQGALGWVLSGIQQQLEGVALTGRQGLQGV
ncbi:hypothetical protein NDU88_008045 [Pleurodeles waltl]|uniref:Uncharacterized protein n=1 Tax=Pleurodeles waltl TaxID=8319 RepID=A0AAV7N3W4_PLEWA|nr:hypothetical protein NDU88_008045 [Pleurodeles waltl]